MSRRIAWVMAGVSAAIVVVFVVPLCLLVVTLAGDRVMAAADQEARTVALLVSSVEDAAQRDALLTAADARSQAHTFVVFADDSTWHSVAPAVPQGELARARAGQAFTVVDADGGRVLVPVALPEGTAVVASSVTTAQLRAGVLPAVAAVVALGLGLIGVAVGVALQAGRRLSAPVQQVADAAHRLRAGELSARATPAGPAETVELARALNGLADRITELLAAEREEVGDLAHRLRTPITALRLDLDGVSDPDLAERLTEHVARLQEATDHIVREARRPFKVDLVTGCDATRVVGERLSFWAALAEDQGRVLTQHLAEGPLLVTIPESELRDVVDILIDNVFAHTPEGVGFAVTLDADGADAVLTVQDAGPGFPAAGRDAGRPGSTGVGLDIARRTLTARGGTLTASDAHPGARVSVRAPRAEQG